MTGVLSRKQLARFAGNLEGENWQQELACLEDSFSPVGQGKKTLQGLRECFDFK